MSILMLGLLWIADLVGLTSLFSAIFGGGRRADQAALLLVLSIAVDRRLPLGDEVAWFADTVNDRRESKLRRLANLLHEGHPLDVALERCPGLVSPGTLLLIQAGVANGLLPDALRDAALRLRRQNVSGPALADSIEWSVFYLMGVLLVTSGIVTFLMVSIVPKMKKIFKDFGTELPSMTQGLVDGADFFVNYFFILWPGVLITVAGSAWLGWTLSRGWDHFQIPMLGHRPRLQTPTLLRILALYSTARRPMEDALNILARRHFARDIGARIQHVANRTSAGENFWSALGHVGFLTPAEGDALQTAARAGNLSWALRELAHSLESRWNHRVAVIREWVRPMVILPFAVLVAGIVIGIFLPLVKLIGDLS